MIRNKACNPRNQRKLLVKNNRFKASVCALIVIIGPAVLAEGETKDVTSAEPFVLVRRLVDTRYFEAAHLASLQDALDQELQKTATLKHGDSISKLIVKEFNFGPSDAKHAYQLIEDKIVELN